MFEEITILKYSFNPLGGLEKQALLISEHLLKQGLNVTILTTSKQNFPKGVIPFFIHKGPPLSFFRLFYWHIRSKFFIKKTKPSLVLALDRTTSQTHIRAGNGVHKAYLENKKKYTGILKNLLDFFNPLNMLINYLEKKAFLTSKIIVNSNMVKDEIIKYYSTPRDKIFVIHNGVEWEKNKESFDKWPEKKLGLLKKLSLNEKPIFLFCGNGYERKGLTLLLKALSLIKQDFHLLIIGKDKKQKKFQQLAASLKLENKTTFLGFQKDLLPYYQLADTFVLPSYYDPFANTTLESLSLGLFNITSKQNGAHEIINKENGIVLESLDVSSLHLALLEALKYQKLKKALLVRNSIKHLDIKNQLKELEKVFL